MPLRFRARHLPRLVELTLTATTAVAQQAPTAVPNEDTRALHALFDAAWERDMREDPLKATYLGDRRSERNWPDMSPAAIERRYKENVATSARLNAIHRENLSQQDQLSYDLFAFEYRTRVLTYAYKRYLYDLRPHEGLQTLSEQAELLPFATAADYDNWIAKLKALDRYIDQYRELLEMAVREKRTQPRSVMERVVPQLATLIGPNAEENPFYAPFKRMPDSIPASERARLQAEGKNGVATVVIPA